MIANCSMIRDVVSSVVFASAFAVVVVLGIKLIVRWDRNRDSQPEDRHDG